MRRDFAFSFLTLSMLGALGCNDVDDDATTSAVATSAGGSGGSVASLAGAGGASAGHANAGSGGASAGAAGGAGHLGGSGGTSSAAGGAAGASGSAGGTALGGSAGAGGMPDESTLLGACTYFWGKRCAEELMCLPTTFASHYADVASCVAQNAAYCAATTLGPSSKATVADVAACFDAYGTLDCSGIYRFVAENGAKPAACTYPAGTTEPNLPCLVSSECQSSYCKMGFDGCGVCENPQTSNKMCYFDAQCSPGNTCANGTCAPYANIGESCENTNCHVDLACVNNTCAPLLADGSVCDPALGFCGGDSVCNGLTNKCAPLLTGNVGDPCGYVASGDYVDCVGGSRCNLLQQIETGVCVAIAEAGSACTFSGQCDDFSTCVEGVCVGTSFATCEGNGGAAGSGGASGAAGTGGSGGGGASGTGGSGGSGGDTLDHGAPSTVYPAPHPPLPQALKGASSVMTKPVIVPVYFGADPLQSQLDDFLGKLDKSTYFPTTVSEYGVGAPTAAPSVIVSDAIPQTIGDADIQAFLLSKLDGTHPEFGVPDINHIYVLFYGDATTISDQSGTGCTDFGGYHSTVVLKDGTATTYAVIPRCGDSAGDVTYAVSHELVESMTDPRVDGGYTAYSGVDQDHLAWAQFGGGELGDLCEANPSNFNVEADVGYIVQSTWSNASAKASHSPCLPWSGPYFAAAPVLDDDIDLGDFGGGITKGVKIPLGESRVVELDLFSDAKTNNAFALSVKDLSLEQKGPQLLSFSLDKTSGVNGEKAYLTITVVALPELGSGETFSIEAKLDGRETQWWGVVGQLATLLLNMYMSSPVTIRPVGRGSFWRRNRAPAS